MRAQDDRPKMPAAKDRGRFITLEGGEGAGKTTQLARILRFLRENGIDVIGTREPGGSPGAEILRRLLLSGSFADLGPAAEAILFGAARIDHIDSRIKPALAAGTFVVCDRFSDSTRAYQGAAGGLDLRFLRALERVVAGDLKPDLTLILDLPPETGLARAAARCGADGVCDRFEREDARFHEKLRAAFLEIAAQEPGRCAVIDAARPQDEVTEAICRIIEERLLCSPVPKARSA